MDNSEVRNPHNVRRSESPHCLLSLLTVNFLLLANIFTIFFSSHVRIWELDHKEGWAPKNWWLWCWRRHLRVPWTAKRSKQSILKEINPEYSLEGLMLKLTLQYYGHLIWRADSLEKTLILGKIEGKRRGWQDQIVGWHHPLNGHEFEQTLGNEEQGSLVCCSPWGHKKSNMTYQLNNNNNLKYIHKIINKIKL